VQQKDASEFMNYMWNSDVQNGQSSPSPEVGVRLMERSGEYRKNLAKLLQDNPDLRELVEQRADALRRYDAARQTRMKGKVQLRVDTPQDR
jgi:hypothetical protein